MSDEYNPFAAEASEPAPAPAAAAPKNYFADTNTAVVKKKKEKPAPATYDSSATTSTAGTTSSSFGSSSYSSTYGGGSQSEVEQLRSALRLRDEEVLKQRAEIDKLKSDHAKELVVASRKPNFPFFYPIVYISIAHDMPEQTMRNQIRLALTLWFFMMAAFIWGFLSVMIPFFDGDALNKSAGWDNDTAAFFLALIWMLAGVPLSFYFWFFRLYTLHRDLGADKTPGVSYFFWFFHGLVNFLWCCIYAIGPPQIPGMAGFVVAVNIFNASEDSNKLYATFIVISGVIWTVCAGFSLLFLLWIVRWYRSSGGRAPNQRDIQRGVVQAAIDSESAPILSK
ncbi:hypothetical protein CAOG_06025 [Capsaspora owczarzaki ATCC 30864]|uniref:Secretory carrier membrane protein n=1 Tax=Capsaspora owczarzaki (strain ATCC 30864) TaxID=595528 RepID=A0A0D2WT89_CAPO3|nr:hypothetical protein CAOG_06025 [Capsaspora owczarzaki ATCC 30864]KJE95585.1 hypothetical protein CAOG_006025 [Capsaspora owczarzaki ATCC 30864]|eukprot:XP_004345615.1 hypothetical protein CAOG_06025 [Capsaspora owczarzaki ATCC 30864]